MLVLIVSSYLVNQGYRFSEINHVSLIERHQIPCVSSAVKIIECSTGKQRKQWADVVSRGFELEDYKDCFLRYANTKGVSTFAAVEDQHFLGGGAVAVFDDMADIGMASTLPEHRGKGVQKSLLTERLQFALRAGAEFAAVITEPGSVSDRNIHKIGFKTAYSRFKLEKYL